MDTITSLRYDGQDDDKQAKDCLLSSSTTGPLPHILQRFGRLARGGTPLDSRVWLVSKSDDDHILHLWNLGSGNGEMLALGERRKAVEQVAKADPSNIQEVAASQLAIINNYYQSGLQQSQQSFRWSLIWGGIGLAFLMLAVTTLLLGKPTEIAIVGGIAGIVVDAFAGTYLFLYKRASDQLAAFRESLESTQRVLLANSMCEKLEGDLEQRTRADLIRWMVGCPTEHGPDGGLKKKTS